MLKAKHLSLILLTAFSLTVFSCGGGGTSGGDEEPTPTPEELRIIALAGTASGVSWAVTSATFENAATDAYDDLVITFIDGTTRTYRTTGNSTPVLNATGTWQLGTSISQLIFDNDANNTWIISSLNTTTTPATARLSVNFTAPGPAAAGTNGTYVFDVQAQ